MSTNHRFTARAGALVASAAMALSVAACGGGSSGGSSGSDSLTLLVPTAARTLEPLHSTYATVTDLNRMLALYDALFYVDNATNTVKPQMGDTLTTADQGHTWTMKLKPNIKFSDGSPLDATAVKANWDAQADPKLQGLHRADVAGVKTEVLDPLTLRITPPMPNAQFDRTVALDLSYIAAPASLTNPGHPVGAGPFTLSSWTRGSSEVLKKNPGYWQADKGLPKVNSVTFKVVPDIKQELDTVRTGQADAFFTIDAQRTAEAGSDQGLTVRPFTLDGGQMIAFNTRRAPFDDPRARRAVTLALDPADLNTKMFDGKGTPARGLFNAGDRFFDPAAAQPSPNHDQAQALFNQLASEGRPVKFSYLVPDNPTSNQTAEYTMTALNSYANVSVTLDKQEVSQYSIKTQVQHDFQAALSQLWASDPEPVMFNALFSKSPTSLTGYTNPAVDSALIAGRSSGDETVRRQAYGDLQKALAADSPLAVYQQAVTAIVLRDRVTGVVGVQDGGMLMDRVGVK